jgi:polyisoprenoid-binding protein YceI
MMKLLASLVALAPMLAFAGTSTWNIDVSHSSAGFAVKHLVISQVRGAFTKFDGKLVLDDTDVRRSTIEATIDVNSVYTRDEQRDGHLKSADFFDVANHPTMTFKSTKVRKAGKDRLAVKGELTLRGVTKPVTLDVTTTPEIKGMYGETRRGFTATTKINRLDYGLAWNKLVEAGPVVGDEVTISLDVEVVKDKPKTASR